MESSDSFETVSANVLSRINQPGLLAAIIFKQPPDKAQGRSKGDHGFNVVDLPRESPTVVTFGAGMKKPSA